MANVGALLNAVGERTADIYGVQLNKELHRGKFGCVYEIKDRDELCLKDMRSLDNNGDPTNSTTCDLAAQLKAFTTIMSPPSNNIVHFKELVSIEGVPRAGYVMQRVDSCIADLYSDPYVYAMEPVHVKLMTRQLLRGLNHLHKNNLVHQELMSQNIMLSLCNGVFKIGGLEALKEDAGVDAQRENVVQLLYACIVPFVVARKELISDRVRHAIFPTIKRAYPHITDRDMERCYGFLASYEIEHRSETVMDLAAHIFRALLTEDDPIANVRVPLQADDVLIDALVLMRQLGQRGDCSAARILDFLQADPTSPADDVLQDYFDEERSKSTKEIAKRRQLVVRAREDAEDKEEEAREARAGLSFSASKKWSTTFPREYAQKKKRLSAADLLQKRH